MPVAPAGYDRARDGAATVGFTWVAESSSAVQPEHDLLVTLFQA